MLCSVYLPPDPLVLGACGLEEMVHWDVKEEGRESRAQTDDVV